MYNIESRLTMYETLRWDGGSANLLIREVLGKSCSGQSRDSTTQRMTDSNQFVIWIHRKLFLQCDQHFECERVPSEVEPSEDTEDVTHYNGLRC